MTNSPFLPGTLYIPPVSSDIISACDNTHMSNIGLRVQPGMRRVLVVCLLALVCTAHARSRRPGARRKVVQGDQAGVPKIQNQQPDVDDYNIEYDGDYDDYGDEDDTTSELFYFKSREIAWDLGD